MSELVVQIKAEIDKVERLVDNKKRLICRAPNNQPIVAAAETELKALNTRLARLRGNLRKSVEQGRPAPTA